MGLEKTKKITKIIAAKKSQLQKQKQIQNVVVNVNAPKATRKRPIKRPPQSAPKTHFQSPIYMPPVVSYNQPVLDTSSIISNILKIINKPKPESNELEKAKPVEREPTPPSPTLPSIFGVPQERISLAAEVKSDPMNTRQTFINTPPFEAKQESFKFSAPLQAERSNLNLKLPSKISFLNEPKGPSLAQKINVGQEKKFTTHPNQPWSELETGGHFGLGAKATEPTVPHLVEEARPTGAEIDLGIVPPEAGEIVQEDRVENDEPPIAHILVEEPKPETLVPEKIATKANTEQMQLKALTMGEEKPFLKSFLHSTPLPPLKTIPFSKDELKLMRQSRVNALDQKPLLLTKEAEPILSKGTNQQLSPEKEVEKEEDPELTKLSKLTNTKLGVIITELGGTPKGKRNKTRLTEGILELRKTQPALFEQLLSKY
jgi:hypothetical protein